MTHRTGPTRRGTLAACAILGLAFSIGAAGCDLLPLFKAERTVSVPHVPDRGLDVMTHNGAITAVRVDREDVQITAHIAATTQERADATEVSAERAEDGSLVIRAVWPENKRYNREQIAYQIETPGASGVTFESHNGELRIERLGGNAELLTHNGAVTVIDHAGRVLIETHNGRVTTERTAADVAVETHNGAITVVDADGTVVLRTHNGRVEATGVGGAAEATSHNGAVSVALRSDNPGSIEASSSNGSITVSIGAAFSGDLVADTDNGSIRTEGLDDITIVEMGKRHLHLSFGDSDARSTLSTDNGSITIHRQ